MASRLHADISMAEVTVPGSCWADNPAVVRIARQVKAMVTALPDLIDDRGAKTEIREGDSYVQVQVVCTFRIPK